MSFLVPTSGVILVTAERSRLEGSGDSVGWEYPVILAPTIATTYTETIFSNSTTTVTTSGENGFPGESIDVLVDGVLCNNTIQGDGSWSCTLAVPAAGKGDYAVSTSYTAFRETSASTKAILHLHYPVDQPRFTSQVDTTSGLGGTVDIDSTTVSVSGIAEPYAEVNIYWDETGTGIPIDPATLMCVTNANSTGNFSCVSPSLTPNSGYSFGVTQTDASPPPPSSPPTNSTDKCCSSG